MALGAIILVGVVILLVVVLVTRPIFVVKHDEAVAVLRLGRPHRILKPGLRWIWPLVESCHQVRWHYNAPPDWHEEAFVDWRVPLREQTHAIAPVQCATENASGMVTVWATVVFQLVDASKALYVTELYRTLQNDVTAEIMRACDNTPSQALEYRRLEETVKSTLGQLHWQAQYGAKLVHLRIDKLERHAGHARKSTQRDDDITVFGDFTTVKKFVAQLQDMGLGDRAIAAAITLCFTQSQSQ